MTSLAEFHRAGDYSDGPTFDPYEYAKIEEEQKREKELGDAINHLNQVLALLSGVVLEKPNKKLEAQLEKQKRNAIDLIREVAERAAAYADVIIRIDQFKSSSDRLDQKNYLKDIEALDTKRTQKHNALLASVNSANRYLRQHFGVLSEHDMDNFVEKEELAGREVLDIERANFPPNGICPNGVNLNDRTSVGDWALHLGHELSAYQNDGNDIFKIK